MLLAIFLVLRKPSATLLIADFPLFTAFGIFALAAKKRPAVTRMSFIARKTYYSQIGLISLQPFVDLLHCLIPRQPIEIYFLANSKYAPICIFQYVYLIILMWVFFHDPNKHFFYIYLGGAC